MQKTREYNPNLCEIAGFSVARFSSIVYGVYLSLRVQCKFHILVPYLFAIPLFRGRWTSSIDFCSIRGVLKYTVSKKTRQLWQAVALTSMDQL